MATEESKDKSKQYESWAHETTNTWEIRWTVVAKQRANWVHRVQQSNSLKGQKLGRMINDGQSDKGTLQPDSLYFRRRGAWNNRTLAQWKTAKRYCDKRMQGCLIL